MSEKVTVIMGSDSDLDTMYPCIQWLRSFGIPTEVHIISAHRTLAAAERFASQARENGLGVIITVTGKATHLAGVLAVYTTLPVIGALIRTSMMGGLDSFLSMVQVPEGTPVACVAVGGVDNAAILAVQIPTLSDEVLSGWLVQFKAGMTTEIEAKNHKIQVEEF